MRQQGAVFGLATAKVLNGFQQELVWLQQQGLGAYAATGNDLTNVKQQLASQAQTTSASGEKLQQLEGSVCSLQAELAKTAGKSKHLGERMSLLQEQGLSSAAATSKDLTELRQQMARLTQYCTETVNASGVRVQQLEEQVSLLQTELAETAGACKHVGWCVQELSQCMSAADNKD